MKMNCDRNLIKNKTLWNVVHHIHTLRWTYSVLCDFILIECSRYIEHHRKKTFGVLFKKKPIYTTPYKTLDKENHTPFFF